MTENPSNEQTSLWIQAAGNCRILSTQVRIAVSCLLLTVFMGLMAVANYFSVDAAQGMHSLGLSMQKMRPLHTTFASAWIFAGALAVIYHYLATHHGGLSKGDRIRFKIHTWLWVAAGVGTVGSVLGGVFTGREYLAFPLWASGVVLLGWGLYAVSFLRRLKHGFFAQPVYVWMWTTGTLYFIYTFVEGHWHYISPLLQEKPTHDLAVQWKSCGTLVGSFNFLIYGCLVYVSERISGDKSYGQSPLAFWLFGVGCLNSFTNFAHHTYHIPQTELVKWIAFVVSMAEAIIFLRLMYDIVRMLQAKKAAEGGPYNAALGFFVSSKHWSMWMIGIGIVISVPHLNALIHGTYVVVGHAMGTELGIDSLVLFGCLTWLIAEARNHAPKIVGSLHTPSMRPMTVLLNIAMAVLVTWLTVVGVAQGWSRYHNDAPPGLLEYNTWLFPACGALLALLLLHLCVKWLRLSFCRAG